MKSLAEMALPFPRNPRKRGVATFSDKLVRKEFETMPKAELEALRRAMAAAGIDMFLVPTADPHGSEYVCGHFKAREYLSGFDGSAGTLLVAPGWAGLWTDGRYFLQAEAQLQGTGCSLFRMGRPGVPALSGHIKATLSGGVLGADFRTLSARQGMELRGMGVALKDVPGLVDAVWAARPGLPASPAYALGLELAGVSAWDKLLALREAMEAANVTALALTALDDIAWLFNIRGQDVQYLPVALAYALVEREAAYLFMEPPKGRAIAAAMEEAGVTLLPYNDVYAFVRRYRKTDTVMAALNKLNYRLYLALEESANVIEGDLVGGMKAVKNPVELENERRVHLADGVAVTRFMHWVKEAVKTQRLTEVEAGAKLDALRLAQPNCTGLSFATICGYGPHGAIIHYQAKAETDIPLEPRGLLLVDSGGQYLGGTTDVTRTIALGEVPPEQKWGFTLVLEGMLALLDARFPRGCAGYHLDAIARAPLWAEGLDFDHGTGHGVGYMLSVHEGPNGFRWKETGRTDRAVLQPGMVTSVEPGLYMPGEYGVRLENLVECLPAQANGFGEFLQFRSLTYAPVDLDAVDTQTLSAQGRARLNRYHAAVYEKLAPLMEEGERERLRHDTRAI